MKERYLSKTSNIIFVYLSKCNINLCGIFGNSKKKFLWTGLIYTYTPLYSILYIYSLCSTTLVDFSAGPWRIGSWQSPTQRPFYGQPPVNEGSTNFPRCTDSSTSRAFSEMPFDFHLMWRGCTKLLRYYSAIFIWCDEDAHCALHKPFMILFSECPKQIIGKLPEKK